MDKNTVIQLLSKSKPLLQERFSVVRLALFGSTARGAASDTSDIDILVAFDSPATFRRYFGVQFYLKDLLGRPVDLVTKKVLRPEPRPYIQRDLISV